MKEKQIAYFGRWNPNRPDAAEVILRAEDDRTFVYKVYVQGEERPRGLTGGVEIPRDFESWAPYAALDSFNFVYDPLLSA